MTTTDAAAHGAPPIDPEVYDRRYRTLAVLCLSLILIVAANSALNVTLPTLVREIGATQTQLQWIVDAYSIVFAGLLLPAGAIGDRFGRKGSLQLGLVTFAVASLGATFAQNPEQLIALRAVMGIGAAFVMPATLSILTTVFPPAERGKAIAIWAGFAGAGGALGPIISGGLLEGFWWGSVFLVNIPIILVALAGGYRLVPTSRDAGRRPLDPVGGVLSMVGLGGLLFGIIEGPERGWTGPFTIAGFALAIVFLGAFVWWEHRSENPMLDLSWFRVPRFVVGSLTITLAFFAAFGVFFLATQYLQFVLDYSPLVAGVASLPLAVSLVIVAPRSAGLAERFGTRTVVPVGLLVVAAGLALFSVVSTPETDYPILVLPFVLVGIGMALTTAPSTTLILSTMTADKAGVGSAVNDTTREMGGSLGVAILGSIVASVYKSGLDVSRLPADVAAAAQRSVGAAIEVASRAPDPAVGQALAENARTAFTNGFSVAFVVAAGVAVAAAVLVRVLLPQDVEDRVKADEGADEPDPTTAGAPA